MWTPWKSGHLVQSGHFVLSNGRIISPLKSGHLYNPDAPSTIRRESTFCCVSRSPLKGLLSLKSGLIRRLHIQSLLNGGFTSPQSPCANKCWHGVFGWSLALVDCYGDGLCWHLLVLRGVWEACSGSAWLGGWEGGNSALLKILW